MLWKIHSKNFGARKYSVSFRLDQMV